MSVIAAKDAITISMPSLRSSMRNLHNFNRQRQLLRYANRVDELLRQQEWTLYLSYGRFTIAMLGSKANRKVTEALIRVIRFVVKT